MRWRAFAKRSEMLYIVMHTNAGRFLFQEDRNSIQLFFEISRRVFYLGVRKVYFTIAGRNPDLKRSGLALKFF